MRQGQRPKSEVALNSRQGQAAENAAQKRWERELRALGVAAYADAVERITPTIAEAATLAEMRKRGEGLRTIMLQLMLPGPAGANGGGP